MSVHGVCPTKLKLACTGTDNYFSPSIFVYDDLLTQSIFLNLFYIFFKGVKQ